MNIAVWIARLLLGATFILSGVSKIIDPYGIQIKIEAYLAAWGLTETIPPGLVLVGGCALAMLEFIVGILLLTGSLRRTAAYSATAIMAFMLPLTVYIAIYNPVEDCGCFGDFLILSNRATMWKNVVLLAAAIFLCKYNRRARWLFAPWIQWVQIAVGVLYMLLIAFAGYLNQPLLDFRAYPIGEYLTADDDEAVYIYQRNGEELEFAEDDLPSEDDGWEFVDMKITGESSHKELALFDRSSGEEVTEEVLGSTSGQILLLIPDPSEVGASESYVVNELQQAMESRYGRGSFIAATAADSVAVERAIDLMMATYPVYYADPKAISTVARGSMALVYLQDGIVLWKRTLNSINLDKLTPGCDISEVYSTNDTQLFIILTVLYLVINLLILTFGLLPYNIVSSIRQRKASRSKQR